MSTTASLLDETVARIRPADASVAAVIGRLLGAKTKPPGSLGRLEDLACRVGAILGRVPDRPMSAAVVVAAADHGVARHGVSAYPSEVTRQMLANFAAGGAAVCVLARRAGARLVVVDAGVVAGPSDEPIDAIVDAVVVRGTDDITAGPAMSRDVAEAMVEHGVSLVGSLADDAVDIVALGEMGIGNTTAASAIVAALDDAATEEVCGPGTGLDDAGIARKVGVIRRALAVNGLDTAEPRDPMDVLARVGGLEIAFLVGVTLGAASRRMPVVLDGAITGAAALIASRIAPASADAMIAATRSPEPSHDVALRSLGVEPLLDLGLRLGEGSGAALALPLVDAAVAVLTEMATFDSASVAGPFSDPG